MNAMNKDSGAELSSLGDSFIILEKEPGSINDDPIKKMNELSSIFSKSSVNGMNNEHINNGMNSVESNSYLTQAQDKISHLQSENNKLKETLNQNNLAMKSHLDLFCMWQQEVLKAHESHAEKFEQTRNIVHKLLKEYKFLKETSENSLNSISYENSGEKLFDQGNENSEEGLRKSESKSKLINNSEKEENVLLAENMILKMTVEELKKEITTLNKKLDELKEENQHLRDDSLKSSRNSFTSLSLPNSEARLQINSLLQQLNKEKEKVQKLEEKLLENTKINDANHQRLKRNDAILNIISRLEKSFQNIIGSYIPHMTLGATLLSVEDNRIDETANCKEIFLLNDEENLADDTFKDVIQNLKKIYYHFYRMSEGCKEVKNDASEVNNLVSKLVEQLDTERKEKSELERKVEKLTLECEEVAALRVQNEVYKSDFNDERQAREKLATEKEVIAEEVRFLQTQLNNYSNSGVPAINEEQRSEPLLPIRRGNSKYVCPKCWFSFSDLRNCEEHVNDCLNEHFYP